MISISSIASPVPLPPLPLTWVISDTKPFASETYGFTVAAAKQNLTAAGEKPDSKAIDAPSLTSPFRPRESQRVPRLGDSDRERAGNHSGSAMFAHDSKIVDTDHAIPSVTCYLSGQICWGHSPF